MPRTISTLLLAIAAVSTTLAAGAPPAPPAPARSFVWPSAVPADCPFPQSRTLTGIRFTGRHSDYRCGDTFYPTWASDGNLYSPWIY